MRRGSGNARRYHAAFARAKPILFIDNEWHGYDHALHLDAVKEFRPKYATVRDLLTREQAKQSDVAYYTIEETLAMAREIAAHADNVILIPKYDCIDRLPREINGKRVVLGYSVASSYGQTELPPSRFAGWPVHLLGGSWARQRSLLNLLRDD